ncbi:MAG: DUF4136 domain-containing protein [Candidatus Acidiferrum sp.]
MNRPCETRWNVKSLLISGLLAILLAALPLFAKTAVDFDPNLDFSRYRTFAFLGGVENLVMMQLNPDLINNRVHRSVTRELTNKGLREVQPGEKADLVVRYWPNSPQQVNISTMGNWGLYGPYIGSYWGWIYNDVAASSAREGCLIVDLIDPKSKNLAWRLYLIRKIANPDKDWKKTDEELAKGFEAYPPSDRAKDDKKKERAAHPPKPD